MFPFSYIISPPFILPSSPISVPPPQKSFISDTRTINFLAYSALNFPLFLFPSFSDTHLR